LLGGLHDRDSSESEPVAAASASITLGPPAVDKPILLVIAAERAKPVGPTRHLRGGLGVLFRAVEPLRGRTREALLKLNAARHQRTGI